MLWVAVVLALTPVVAVARDMGTTAPLAAPPTTTSAPTTPLLKRASILRRLPHDADAFTQGLLLRDGVMYESTGLLGRSTLRIVDAESGTPQKVVALAPEMFGEGLAAAGDVLYQLTWKNGVCLKYDASTLAQRGRLTYEGEGWGLAYDGTHLIMSNGSSELVWRDPATFAEVRRVTVTLSNGPTRTPLPRLNELEWAEGRVYANVLDDDRIYEINPTTGEVTAIIDCSALRPPGTSRTEKPLNGVAYRPDRKTWYITGKLWPVMYEVKW